MYVVGSREMWREQAREMIRTASATGITQAPKSDREHWAAKMRAYAGEP